MADTETAAARGDNAVAGEAVHDSTLELQPHLALDSCISASDSAVPVCRICYGEADEENGILLMPCNCRGSIAFAHRLCLEVCLREWDTDRCKVCRARIKVRRKRAPLWRFFRDPESRKDLGRIAINTAAGTGDVIVLVLSWIYATNALEDDGWLVNFAVFSFLLFLTAVWIVVEAARAFVCYERVRTLRKNSTTIELLPDAAYLANVPAKPATAPKETAEDGDSQAVTEAGPATVAGK